MSEPLVGGLRDAWAEIDRLRAFIKSLEWSGTAIVDYDGVDTECCPSCNGLEPGGTRGAWSRDYHEGHREDCALVAILAPSQHKGTDK